MTNRIVTRIAASIKSLAEIKDVTDKDAVAIRAVWHTVDDRKEARGAINKILNTYGVEYLGRLKRTGQHVYYANGGDIYATTVLFIGSRMVVGCIGDYIERTLLRKTETY